MKQLLSRINLKKFLIRLLPYLIIAYFFDKVSWLYRFTPQDQILYKFIYTISNIQYAFHSFLPSFHPIDLLFGASCGAAFRIALYVRSKNAKKFRPGNEFGSARWGTAEDIKPYVDPVFEIWILPASPYPVIMGHGTLGPMSRKSVVDFLK